MRWKRALWWLAVMCGGGLGLLTVLLGVLWISYVGVWSYPVKLLAWWQFEVLGKTEVPLRDVTPFGWDKVCTADRSYNIDQLEADVAREIGVPGFDVNYLGMIFNDWPGGYLLFTDAQRTYVVALEWNALNVFFAGAHYNFKCWGRNARLKYEEYNHHRTLGID